MRQTLWLECLLSVSAVAFPGCGGSTHTTEASDAASCGSAGVACCAMATCSSGLVCTAGTCSSQPTSDAAGGVTYHDITDPSFWSSSSLTSGDAFAGGAFDGRYVYYSPRAGEGESVNGVVARYDTHSGFSEASSWASYTLPETSTLSGPFGAVFDGRYIYFVPHEGSTQVVRYDTRASFASAASWSTFVSSVTVETAGYEGGVFDGRYLYLVPSADSLPNVIRYDTQAAFAASSSWTSFDISSLAGELRIFGGAVFDGRYIYVVPSGTYYPAPAIRYDTTASFTSVASWSAFDTTKVGPNEWGYLGGAFDGRYVYFVPYESSLGGVLRYDTHSPFGSSSSWSTFDTSTLSEESGGAEFGGAAFDGRYVYFVPGPFSVSPVLVRLDTTADFGSPEAWSVVGSGVGGPFNPFTSSGSFIGAVFDGQYVYPVPTAGGNALRFDAKTPPSMPKGYSGSFL
jgi:hypothetical protein